MHKLDVRYMRPDSEELRAFKALGEEKWHGYMLLDGAVRRNEDSGTYFVNTMFITLQSGRMFNLLVATEDVLDEEFSRVGIMSDPAELRGGLQITKPRMKPLKTVPKDLDLLAFLDVCNRVSLIRRKEEIATEDEDSTVILFTDFALIVENSKAQMALYPDRHVLVDLLLTTDRRAIKELVAESEEIITV